MPVRRQVWFYLMISVLVLVLTNLPYFLATRAAGTNTVFGGFLFNPLDGNTYLAKMYEGWRGDWQFTLPYTAEVGHGAFLFLFYLFLGHLAHLLGLSLIITFHTVRIFATLMLLLALYRFCTALLPEPRQQKIAFGLAALGSGLGWLALLFGAFTADFWVAEAYPFLSAYANPHFPLGLALLLWLLAPEGEEFRAEGILKIGSLMAASFLLGIISPFGVIVALVVLGGLSLWRILPAAFHKHRLPEYLHSGLFRRLFWIFLGGAPVVVYEVWVAANDPLFAAWNAQNLTPSPPVWDVFISLSPVLLLAVPGAWWAMRGGNLPARIPLVWAGLGLLLLYLPFGLQRRFMMGIYIPLAVLAVIGLVQLSKSFGQFRLLTVGLFLLVLPTNLVILLAAQHGIQTQDPNLYLSSGEAHAFTWVRSHTSPGALILAAPDTGLFIPAYTGRRVLYGHPFETVNASTEKAAVTDFFANGGANSAFLDQRHVDYVFWGPRERKMDGSLLTSRLSLVYSSGDVALYAVER